MRDILSKLVDIVKSYQKDIFVVVCVILIAITAYNLGEIKALKQSPVSINQNPDFSVYQAALNTGSNKNTAPAVAPIQKDEKVVVSKNSDKYHYTWCSGATRIKPENQIWFNSASEAEAAGYTLAGNCQP